MCCVIAEVSEETDKQTNKQETNRRISTQIVGLGTHKCGQPIVHVLSSVIRLTYRREYIISMAVHS